MPTEKQSFECRFVASGPFRTMFYYYKNRYHRFNVSSYAREFAAIMGGAITAFIIDEEDLVNVSNTILCNKLISEGLRKFREAKVVNPAIFGSLDRIEFNMGSITPDLFPEKLQAHSSYYGTDACTRTPDNVYLPHAFYNNIVEKYGYLDRITILILYLLQYTNVKHISVRNTAEPLQIFKVYDRYTDILTALDSESIRLHIKSAYETFNCNRIKMTPVITLPTLQLSFPSRQHLVQKSFVQLCICCHIKSAAECNELILYLLDVDVAHDLIITVIDSKLQDYLQSVFPDAVILHIPVNGEDIGGFLQALNYIYTLEKRYNYICKVHFHPSYLVRTQSLQLLSCLSTSLERLLREDTLYMIGEPAIKCDYLHGNYLVKYINRYEVQHSQITMLQKILTPNDQQVKRQSPAWMNLSKKSRSKFIASGVFVCKMSIFNEQMVDTFDELSTHTSKRLNDSYDKQCAEFAWLRFFGILGKL